jgi:hypothetical protein
VKREEERHGKRREARAFLKSFNQKEIKAMTPDLIILSRYSFSMRTKSRIYLPLTWGFEIIFFTTLLNLLTRTLAIIL